jgi:hypothetical protein
MPHKTRKRPGKITIKAMCCSRGITMSTEGDDIGKTCWNCNSYVRFRRHPEPREVTINGRVTENWHVVSEEPPSEIVEEE